MEEYSIWTYFLPLVALAIVVGHIIHLTSPAQQLLNQARELETRLRLAYPDLPRLE